jgi:hypothetical protein
MERRLENNHVPDAIVPSWQTGINYPKKNKAISNVMIIKDGVIGERECYTIILNNYIIHAHFRNIDNVEYLTI